MSPDSEFWADDSLASPIPLCVSPQTDTAPPQIVDIGDDGSIIDVPIGLRAPIVIYNNQITFYLIVALLSIPGSGLMVVDGD